MKNDLSVLPLRQKPKILEVAKFIETPLFNIEKVSLEFRNGEKRVFQRFEQWPHGIVMVVPMLDNETMLLIREYGVGIEDYVLTLPKGKVDAGETPLEAANRELQEEIGYASNQLTLLRSVTQSPSYSSTRMHIFLAEDLRESKLEGDEPEPIEVVSWEINKMDELIEREDFHEGRAIAALYLVQQHLAKR